MHTVANFPLLTWYRPTAGSAKPAVTSDASISRHHPRHFSGTACFHASRAAPVTSRSARPGSWSSGGRRREGGMRSSKPDLSSTRTLASASVLSSRAMTSRTAAWSPAGPVLTLISGQITGGRPALVIRQAVRSEIGRRGPGSMRQPSAKPRNQGFSGPSRPRDRATVSAVQSAR